MFLSAARLAWLWPLLGIMGEVLFLVVVIGTYELRRYWLKHRDKSSDESLPLDQQQQQHFDQHEDALQQGDHTTDIRLRTLPSQN